MAADRRFSTPRIRTLLGLSVVAVSLLVAVILAGLSFAQGSPAGAQSAAQDQYGRKITICHHTHSKKHPMHTISISVRAWPAHQRHGDTLGPCTATTPTTATTPKHGKSGTAGDNGKQNGNNGNNGHHGKP